VAIACSSIAADQKLKAPEHLKHVPKAKLIVCRREILFPIARLAPVGERIRSYSILGYALRIKEYGISPQSRIQAKAA
jgi:hypothetical protein